MLPQRPQTLRVSALAMMMVAAVGAEAAEPDLSQAPMLSLELRGVGELRFGDTFQWSLVVAPPKEVRQGEGIRLGEVSIRSANGKVTHTLPEPAAFSYAENGSNCGVYRLATYTLIRCQQDYVFDTRTGAPPLLMKPQFNDRTS